MDHRILADLIDDLTPQQLTDLLNWLAIHHTGTTGVRASIKGWRRQQKLPLIY